MNKEEKKKNLKKLEEQSLKDNHHNLNKEPLSEEVKRAYNDLKRQNDLKDAKIMQLTLDIILKNNNITIL